MAKGTPERIEEEAGLLHSRSQSAFENNDMATAINSCRELNRRFPDFFDGWKMAGRIHLRLRKPEAGLISTARALAIRPEHPNVLMQRAECLALLNRSDELKELLVDLANCDFSTAQEHADLAMMLAAERLHHQAIIHYQKAIYLNDETPSLHYNLAAAYRFIGEVALCEQSLEHALRLNPFDGEAQMMRSSLRKQTPEQNHVDELLATYKKDEVNDKVKSGLCFALAKEEDDLDNFDASFAYLAEGCDIRRRQMSYDVKRDEELMQKIADGFHSRKTKITPKVKKQPKPIFIVGLPRSGSTMLERMLDNHSAVQSMGELDTFAAALTQQMIDATQATSASAEDLIEFAATVDLAALANTYLTDSAPQHFSGEYFIDKLPLNFLYLGLIHQAMPEAKIIHIRRHPVASCFAMYRQWFRDIYPFSYDLSDLGRYFIAYDNLMQFWEHQLPGAIHTVQYENIVAKPELEMKRVLSFCELPWEGKVIAFQDNLSPSTTASALQIRQPIHNKSAERWRYFSHHLKPLLQALESGGIDVS